MRSLLPLLVYLWSVGQIMTTTLPPSKSTSVAAQTLSCSESGCGPNAICIIKYLSLNKTTSYCTCKRGGYFGDPNIGCVAECETNDGCGGGTLCSRNECVDACPHFCGDNMKCELKNYAPTCTCVEGFHNVPGHQCVPDTQSLAGLTPFDPCEPSPCGRHAWCSRTSYSTFECNCIHKNGGKPPNCRPQCSTHSDCGFGKYCSNNYCENSNGRPLEPTPGCSSDGCGLFGESVVVGNRRVCKCLAGYYGSPPNCKPECEQNSDCPAHRSCDGTSQTCVNPCEGACSSTAVCNVQNHTPVCYCPKDTYQIDSDPFKICYVDPVIPTRDGTPPKVDYCVDSVASCGPNAKCTQENYFRKCSCLDGTTGSPPNCYRECTQNSECTNRKACLNSKCVDPCAANNVCGLNENCNVVNHEPVCSCAPGYVTNKFAACVPSPNNPCDPSPCGFNSTCGVDDSGVPCCRCLPNYYGDPSAGCRPECSVNQDCPRDRACIRNVCVDPCKGTCGLNANCKVVNHSPICSCWGGYTGDPFRSCLIQQVSACDPNFNCGPYSQCSVNEIQRSATCTCNHAGIPPNCKQPN